MLKLGVNTNNGGDSSDKEILNNTAIAGFKNVMLSFKTKNIDKSIKN